MPSKERGQKFHADDVSLPRSGSASDWLKQILENFPRQSTNQRHYSDLCGDASYGISALVSRTSFFGGSVAKCRLFSQDTLSS